MEGDTSPAELGGRLDLNADTGTCVHTCMHAGMLGRMRATHTDMSAHACTRVCT